MGGVAYLSFSFVRGYLHPRGVILPLRLKDYIWKCAQLAGRVPDGSGIFSKAFMTFGGLLKRPYILLFLEFKNPKEAHS